MVSYPSEYTIALMEVLLMYFDNKYKLLTFTSHKGFLIFLF